MKEYNYLIGENNKTKELEINKITDFLNKHFEGFTIVQSLGFWKSNPEKSAKVSIITNMEKSKMESLGNELKSILEQESIILTEQEFNGQFL